MTHTWCLDCGHPCAAKRCPTCRSKRYGATHQTDRQRWATLVARGTVRCWRCSHTIAPDEPWDLGHRSGRPSHPEHANRCNRSAAARF